MTPLLLLLTTLAQAQPEPPATAPVAPAMHLLAQQGTQLTLLMDGDVGHLPGDTVGVYLWEARPDPRTGEMLAGSRYAGDARVVWVGGDLVMLELVHTPQALELDRPVELGASRSSKPTIPWVPAVANPPAPEPTPPLVAQTETVLPEESPPDPDMPLPPLHHPGDASDDLPKKTRSRSAIGVAHADHYGGRRQQVSAHLDWSDDGHQTGTGLGELRWSTWPEKTVGAVHISLQGLRGMRWVSPENRTKKEPWARAPAAGYWLWTRVETPGVDVAVTGGLAVGVNTAGPNVAAAIGLRLGADHAGHVRLDWDQYGDLGYRGALLGMVPLTDRFRLGLRARAGALTLHEAPPVYDFGTRAAWRQVRADGTVRISWDIGESLTFAGGLGRSGYDLVSADAGPVLDGALEVRW